MDFLPVRIGTLRPDSQVTFDMYLLIAGKYLHYLRSQEILDLDRLGKLKAKGVRKIYIPYESEPGYLAYLDSGLSALASPDRPLEERTEMARDAMGNEAENIQHNLETEQAFRATEGRMGKLVDFLLSDQGALKSVLDSTGCSMDDTQHSAAVAFLSLGLAVRVGGLNAKELFDLSIAALLHDIGKQKLGILFSDPAVRLSSEDRKKLESHPQAAVDLVQDKRFITPSVLRLIVDHEECSGGQGYPGKKNLNKLPLNSQLLNLCNHFDRTSMLRGVSHTALVKDYFQEFAHLFSMEHITLLGEVLAAKGSK